MATRIRLTVDDEHIVVRLHDNATSGDLRARLPITLEFEDYANTEKIAVRARETGG